MTAAKLLDNALALLLTTSAQTPEYTDSTLPLVNMLLCETTPYNDLLREAKGLPATPGLLQIGGMEDELPCEEVFAVMALPHGLCAKLLMDDDDMAKVTWFQNRYLEALSDAAGTLAASVKDRYPGGEGA